MTEKTDFQNTTLVNTDYNKLIAYIDRLSKKIKGNKRENADKLSQSLYLLRQSINVVKINFNKFSKSVKQRSELIDEQIAREIFEGDLHNRYHEVIEEVETDLNNLFLSIKTLSNRIPDFIYLAATHTDRRQVKTGSFGKFINSLDKADFSNPQIKQIFRNTYRICKKLDEESNSYRDRFIEHTKPSTYESVLVSKGEGSVIRLHYKKNKKDNSEKINPIGGKPHWTKMTVSVGDLDFGYYYYVHISMADKIKSGYKMKKGELMGMMYDSDTKHFEKYPQHMHVFRTKNLPEGNILGLTDEDYLEYSPEPVQMVSKVFNSILNILKSSNTYIDLTR